jgi:hypothetical protein
MNGYLSLQRYKGESVSLFFEGRYIGKVLVGHTGARTQLLCKGDERLKFLRSELVDESSNQQEPVA